MIIIQRCVTEKTEHCGLRVCGILEGESKFSPVSDFQCYRSTSLAVYLLFANYCARPFSKSLIFIFP